MSVTRIAHRYAKSLIDLAIEQGKLDRVLEDVKTFHKISKNRDFYLFLKNPIVHQERKVDIVKKIFKESYDELTLAFLVILIKKGREMQLPEIANEFLKQYKQARGISTVKVTSASKLSQETLDRIREKLLKSNKTDKNIEMITRVNPDLIGGLIIEFDDWVYDASLEHKLEEFRRKLFSENPYISQIIAR